MAAYAALVSLMNTMEQIMDHPLLSTSFNKKQIESLRKKLEFLLDFVESYDNSHGRVAEILERQIASAAIAAEDVIESRIIDQNHAEPSQVSSSNQNHAEPSQVSSSLLFRLRKQTEALKKSVMKALGKIRSKADKSYQKKSTHAGSIKLQKIIKDMDSIKKKVMKLKEKRGPTYSSPAASSRPLPTGRTINAMVGFEDEFIQIMDVLTDQQSSRQIISVVGMGGAGKTTLARNVYESSLAIEHFHFRAWATISQQYDVREILLQLLSSPLKFTDETVGELGERLYKSLSGRRYLIVLDDMWSIEVWDNIKFFFPDNGNRSRVVLTTRLLNVATHFCSFCIRIKFLDEHKSWDLFCQNVFGQEDCPPELVGIGKKIVQQCKGLPLTIVVIGGLLRKSYMTEEYWQNVAKDINSVLNSRETVECLDVLHLSYIHLPARLKPCFLYMGAFEEDFEIRVSEIIKLWVAEGFLKPNNVQILEEIAEDYLKELIDRNLILVCALRSNGKMESFRIHDLLRELCLRVGGEEKFFDVVRTPSFPRGIDSERCPIFHGFTTFNNNSIADKFLKFQLRIRSLHLSAAGDSPFTAIYLPGFPNVNLRYAVYLNRNWSVLPSSISLIWNLQTLIIMSSHLIVAPLEIWKMRQLRHLKCSRIMLPDPPSSDDQDDSVVLGNLLTLRLVVNFMLSEEVCKRILNIKKLCVKWEGYDDGLFGNLLNLGRLHKLESLKLWCFGMWRISINELKNAFPSSLNKLTLGHCSLDWEDLSMIVGSLPQLEVFKLDWHFGEECEWSSVEGGFLRLKFLSIQYRGLQSWTFDSASCFPVLENLFLVHCECLNEIPSGIGHIPTLQLIRLEFCTESAAISAVKIKEEQECYGNEGLQIQVMMSSEERERFNDALEIEGLSINNVRLLERWE